MSDWQFRQYLIDRKRVFFWSIQFIIEHLRPTPYNNNRIVSNESIFSNRNEWRLPNDVYSKYRMSSQSKSIMITQTGIFLTCMEHVLVTTILWNCIFSTIFFFCWLTFVKVNTIYRIVRSMSNSQQCCRTTLSFSITVTHAATNRKQFTSWTIEKLKLQLEDRYFFNCQLVLLFLTHCCFPSSNEVNGV